MRKKQGRNKEETRKKQGRNKEETRKKQGRASASLPLLIKKVQKTIAFLALSRRISPFLTTNYLQLITKKRDSLQQQS